MNNPGPNARLARVAQFVQNRLEEIAAQHPTSQADPDYRWQHTLRVSNYGCQIAQAEGANVELVVAACLPHDVAHFDPGDWKDHGRLGAEIARPFLLETGYSAQDVDNICHAIASHVDGPSLDTLEAKIVTDADNVDRFGAYRIIQWCTADVNSYEEMVARLEERVPRLENYRQQELMETKTGQALFNQQLDLQIAVFKALIEEKSLTVLPEL